jgi:hypothetical protein
MSIATSMGEAPATGSGGVWDRRLLLNLKGCRIEAARSAPVIRAFCRDLAEALDLRPCAAPALVGVGGPDAASTGLSLTHTLYGATVAGAFTDRDGDAHLSILSVQAFPVEPVVRVARKHFAPRQVSETVLTRQP